MTEVSIASPRRLMWLRFRRHKLAVVCMVVIGLAYVAAATCEFWAPTTQQAYHSAYAFAPPQRIHIGSEGLYVNGYKSSADPVTMERKFTADPADRIELRFFAKGESYRLFGLIPTDRHFLAPSEAGRPFYLLGADQQGR